jgi:predicted dehydrogenase
MLLGLLRFENGALAVLDINWLSPIKLRELTVTGSRGMYQVNYLTQELSFRENGWHPPANGNGWEALTNFVGVGEGSVTSLPIHRKEPLRAELESFADAVREGRDPMVGGAQGLHALRVAELLIEAGRTGQTIYPQNSTKESA